jgi:diguanylate cyclase (GGDEF)-like protein
VREWAIRMNAFVGKTGPGNLWGCLASGRFAANTGLWTMLLLAVSTPLLARGADTLPILRSVRRAHILSGSEAVRSYPVHLDRAQVTYYDPTIFCLFIMDSTDGIFVDFRDQSPPQIRAGDIVTVDAVSGPGQVNAVLLHARFRVLRHAPLPDAPPVSFDRVLSGAWDSRWISLEGVVRSVRRPSEMTAYAGEPGFGRSNIILTLSSGPDLVDVITTASGSVDPSSLIDANIRLGVVVGCRFNQRHQLIGVHVYVNNLSGIEILARPPADPYSLPVTETAGVMRRSLFAPGHRVRVHGVVTSSFGTRYSLMDHAHGIFVYTDTPASVKVGDLLDVVGFPSMGGNTVVITDAIERNVGVAMPPSPVTITAVEALGGDHDAESIRVDGLLLYKSRTANEETLLLTDNGITFSASIPANAPGDFDNLQPGSRLRVTGTCLIEVTPSKTPKALQILLQSRSGITVISQPSWWTSRNTLILSTVMLVVIAIVLAWNLILRRLVRRQTSLIRAQLENAHTLRLRAEAAHREKSESLANVLSLQQDLLVAQEKLRFQANHDTLTGLWTRAALLELLRKEIDRAVRSNTTVGVLMLDVDHFKAVNDTLGHLAGDEVLKEIAHSINQATRTYDLTGRFGGEEFLVVLPGCDREKTKAGAERIRDFVASHRFHARGTEISVTVSVGATIAPFCGRTESEILNLADRALYQAKNAGRNCTIVRTEFDEEQD